jgi:hypothetical protein
VTSPSAAVNHNYLLVAEADASCFFKRDSGIALTITRPEYTAELIFETRQVSFGEGLPLMPGSIDIRAEILSPLDLVALGSAIGSNIRSIMSTISVAANAIVELAEPVYLADITPGLARRQVFQALSKLRPNAVPKKGNIIDPAATLALIYAAGKESETGGYLARAIEYYAIALHYLNPDTLALAVMHLFIAAENLKLLALQVCGLSVEELAETQKQLMDLQPFKDNQDKQRAAENYCRDAFVFHKDHETHKKAGKVSDGLEHGFRDFKQIRDLARECAMDVAAHVRNAIMELAGLAPEHRLELCSTRYAVAISSYPTVHIFADVLDPVNADDKWERPFELQAVRVAEATLHPDTGDVDVAFRANAKAKVRYENARMGAST